MLPNKPTFKPIRPALAVFSLGIVCYLGPINMPPTDLGADQPVADLIGSQMGTMTANISPCVEGTRDEVW